MKIFRYYALVFIVLNLFLTGFVMPPSARAADISMSVEENPYNKAAAQLKLKENSLNEKEKLLNKYETQLQRSNMFVALAVLVLFLLIMLNYYLDYHRKKLDEADNLLKK